MLQLKNIVKTYETGGLKQNALKGVSIAFRKNEFVSILGQSGSGKTTMLNIIGGLDRYTDGDLVINGVSTKKYKDGDWDYYRNNSIGFVFQSYNLIPHQSVLANVELALTLAGISKKERRQRAVNVLKKVGLGDHIHKKPNQMSGGQMQRVAIARALINNPDILLADEPTGALDSETSLQIMELLNEIAKDKLVIMVTHNPDLAEQYSTRIVKLLDGEIISDSSPYECGELTLSPQKRKKISMSFFTALSLSFNNLKTKKGRTLLTSFAGSIGIIGIALILSISTGIQTYVNNVQRDTLSSYPIAITAEDNSTISGLLSAREEIPNERGEPVKPHENDAVYSSDRMYTLFNAAFAGDDATNNLTLFKEWLDKEINPQSASTKLAEYVSTVSYQYNMSLNTYIEKEDGWHSTDVSKALTSIGGTGSLSAFSGIISTRLEAMNKWSEMLPGTNGEPISDLVYDQYDVVAGRMPSAANEIVLVLDKNNEISDLAFYTLGMMTEDEINGMFGAALKGEEVVSQQKKLSYDDVLNTTFKMVLNAQYYNKNADGKWEDIREDEAALKMVIDNGYELKIVGILRPNPEATSASISGAFAYTSALTEYMIKTTNECEIVKEQRLPENENYDILTGLPFIITEEIDLAKAQKAERFREYAQSLNAQQKTELYTDILSEPSPEYLEQTVNGFLQQYPTRESMIDLIVTVYNFDKEAASTYAEHYTDEELRELLKKQVETIVRDKYAEQAALQISQIKASTTDPNDLFGAQGYIAVATTFDQALSSADVNTAADYYDKYMSETVSGSTLAETLSVLGAAEAGSPASINIYAATFEDKEIIDEFIAEYNSRVSEEDKITYTDYVGLLMSGVTTMINSVSYGLIGFVSISLIVSSIMIGIITYISVLERTKEIGILRSVGASKKDVSLVFNAETIIIGLVAGLIGIGITVLLNIPISIIAYNLTGISGIAVLPAAAGAILVAISVALTMIAGLVPSKMAAKKDPVVALRTE